MGRTRMIASDDLFPASGSSVARQGLRPDRRRVEKCPPLQDWMLLQSGSFHRNHPASGSNAHNPSPSSVTLAVTLAANIRLSLPAARVAKGGKYSNKWSYLLKRKALFV